MKEKERKIAEEKIKRFETNLGQEFQKQVADNIHSRKIDISAQTELILQRTEGTAEALRRKWDELADEYFSNTLDPWLKDKNNFQRAQYIFHECKHLYSDSVQMQNKVLKETLYNIDQHAIEEQQALQKELSKTGQKAVLRTIGNDLNLFRWMKDEYERQMHELVESKNRALVNLEEKLRNQYEYKISDQKNKLEDKLQSIKNSHETELQQMKDMGGSNFVRKKDYEYLNQELIEATKLAADRLSRIDDLEHLTSDLQAEMQKIRENAENQRKQLLWAKENADQLLNSQKKELKDKQIIIQQLQDDQIQFQQDKGKQQQKIQEISKRLADLEQWKRKYLEEYAKRPSEEYLNSRVSELEKIVSARNLRVGQLASALSTVHGNPHAIVPLQLHIPIIVQDRKDLQDHKFLHRKRLKRVFIAAMWIQI
ncbi:MAG: hypothetical protein EZS28_024126 [Streblomastix strix]|uniref:Uncharacterized protein n=1 Tax=Streblomastix strix TaxID=222440 RepID=A0A5J4VCP9_9EUKA|nr:MAG: hypothetical protein EZS28_024126 [Streblomastix strix]